MKLFPAATTPMTFAITLAMAIAITPASADQHKNAAKEAAKAQKQQMNGTAGVSQMTPQMSKHDAERAAMQEQTHDKNADHMQDTEHHGSPMGEHMQTEHKMTGHEKEEDENVGHANMETDHKANHSGEMMEHAVEEGRSSMPKGVEKQLDKKQTRATEQSDKGAADKSAAQGQEQRQKTQPWWKFWE
jgi:hypothetical protein